MSLKSEPPTPESSAAVKKRIEVALTKHDRGEPLTEGEMRVVYWTLYGGGCHAGGGSPGVHVVVAEDLETASGRRRPV